MLCLNISAQHKDVLLLDSLVKHSMIDKADSLMQIIDLSLLDESSKIELFYTKGKYELKLRRLNEAAASLSKGATLLGSTNVSEQAFDFCYYRGIVERELLHWDLAQDQITRGREIAKKLDNKIFLYESELLQSNLFNYQEKYDSAGHYMTLAKAFVDSDDYIKLSKIENNLGVLNMEMKDFQKALSFFKKAKNLRENIEDTTDVHYNQLYINMADCHLELNELVQAEEYMSIALTVAEDQNDKVELAQLLRLKVKFIAIENGFNEIPVLIELANDLEHDLIDSTVHDLSIKYNVQFKDTLIADQGKIIQTKEKELSVETLKAQNRMKGMFLLGLSLLGGLLLFYFYNKNQKIKHELALSKEIINKQEALSNERTRIAAEMHDDLGGGLTKIKFLGQKMLRKVEDADQKEKLHKIVENSQSLVTNMSEIIWAMNPGFDTLENLIAYSRRFTSEYLQDHEIKLSFMAEEMNQRIEFSGEKRRHVFLVYKELLHNIVKHADASQVFVDWQIINDSLTIIVKDNGIGIEANNEIDEVGNSGNGLRNMKMRIGRLGGTIEWQSNNGTRTEINMSLLNHNLND